MSVANWLHESGISASSIWKTMEPSGLVILEDRLDHVTVEKGSCPAFVNLREIFMRSNPFSPKRVRARRQWRTH
jgi:hypothetical protein